MDSCYAVDEGHSPSRLARAMCSTFRHLLALSSRSLFPNLTPTP